MSEPAPVRPSWRDRLLTLIVALLPQHALSRLVFHLSRRRSRLKNIAIRWFVRRYGVDLAEAACERPEDYPHFNAFFTRALKAGARPIDRDPDALVSPSDGCLSEFGRIETGRLLQAKGHDYRLLDLLGGRRHLAEAFGDGAFTTIYLAPGDYHRVHMPLAGRLQTMLFIPGRLYSVAPFTTRVVRGLFARNQRVVCHFEGEDGPFCVVLVGALNVSAIETVWHGLVRPPRERSGVIEYRYAERPVQLDKGEELGRFNLGSTVILLTAAQWRHRPELAPGARLRVGQRIAERSGA